jgi:branched-chain amino acid transport system substrate-binding protein
MEAMSGRLRGLLRGGTALLTTAALIGMAACGSGDDGDGGGGTSGGALPAEIKVISSNPETGPAAFAGLAANKGYEVAIEEINSTGYLGSTKIVLEKQDTTGKIPTAAQQATQAVADKDVAAVFGSVSSQESVAQAPIADKSKMPIIFTQAGSEGVVIGDYTYRVTPPMSSYYPRIEGFIKAQGIKRMGIIYTAVAPTLKEIG